MGLQETLKAMSDPTRREILTLLQDGNLTAREIAMHFQATAPTISHHLAVLKCIKTGWIDCKYKRRKVYPL